MELCTQESINIKNCVAATTWAEYLNLDKANRPSGYGHPFEDKGTRSLDYLLRRVLKTFYTMHNATKQGNKKDILTEIIEMTMKKRVAFANDHMSL
jgi:hypothetical protein